MCSSNRIRQNAGLGSDHRRRVYSDIRQLIASPENPTPLVRLNRINPNPDFPVYLKLERYNPFGSVKDRVAFEMLQGLDVDGKKIVEPSSGNTGIALACLANIMGIPVEIAVPEAISEEKKALLKLLGAKIWEADDALCPRFPTEGARGLVDSLVRSTRTSGEYVSPNQYENELNVRAHYRNTGPEIWKQTSGRVSHFFAALGTCGTITGVGRFLKEQSPDIRIVAVEPASPEHRLPGIKRITGLADQFVPKILDNGVIDAREGVSDDEAYGTAIKLARQEGILVGPTTGAVLVVALRYARHGKGLGVVISPDDAFKYAGFYRDHLSSDHADLAGIVEHDFSDLVCPLSRVRVGELIDTMRRGERVRIVLGDAESLKSVAQELRVRGIRPDFEHQGEDRFQLTIVK